MMEKSGQKYSIKKQQGFLLMTNTICMSERLKITGILAEKHLTAGNGNTLWFRTKKLKKRYSTSYYPTQLTKKDSGSGVVEFHHFTLSLGGVAVVPHLLAQDAGMETNCTMYQ